MPAQLSPPMVVAFAGLLGLVIGSFLNVVIHRLPKMLEREWRRQCAELAGEPLPADEPFNLLFPRSHCPHCGQPIAARDNIPLIGFLWLKGRCRHCACRIPWRYPLVEAAMGLLFAFAAWRFGLAPPLLAAVLFIAIVVALAVIDLETQLLPDALTLPLLWLGLLANLKGLFAPLEHAVIGAVAGYLALWLVFWTFKLLTKKEGMGYGDFKLAAALGAWFGWPMLPLAILLSSLLGAVVGVALIAAGRGGRDKPIPFGPYLAAAGLVILFGGEWLQRTWISHLGY